MSFHTLYFQFYDVELQLACDSEAYITPLVQMYEHFRKDHPSSQGAHVCATFQTQTQDPPILKLNGTTWQLPDRSRMDGYTYGYLLRTVLGQVRSHLLFHAGVVAHQDRGILLVADSMHGKTTLVLELIKRGFQFLSDDMAALSLADGNVHPYLRRFSVRPSTLALVNLPGHEQAVEWFGNLAVDVESVRPGSIGQPVPVHHIVILQDAEEAAVEPLQRNSDELVFIVDRVDQSLLAQVAQLADVRTVSVGQESGWPTIDLRVNRQMSVLPALETLCQDAGILIYDYIRRPLRRPQFASIAQMERLPLSQGILELLRHLQNEHHSPVRQEVFSHSPIQLFTTVAQSLAHATCHRLLVGPLDQNADAICALMRCQREKPSF